MTPSDRLHELAKRLWEKAANDGDYSYKPVAIRIDPNGWLHLLNSRNAHHDGSFDRFDHPEKRQWRGLKRIMVHKPVEAFTVKEVDGSEPSTACEMLCIEAHQPGENGRRKYYDATPEELAAAMSGEGWA